MLVKHCSHIRANGDDACPAAPHTAVVECERAALGGRTAFTRWGATCHCCVTAVGVVFKTATRRDRGQNRHVTISRHAATSRATNAMALSASGKTQQ